MADINWQQILQNQGGMGQGVGDFGGMSGLGGFGGNFGGDPNAGMPGMGGSPDMSLGPANPYSMRQRAAGGGDKDKMLMDYLSTMGGLQPEQQQLARQRAMADQLRKTPMPEMRSVSGGRIQRASNPLEMVAAAAGQGIGNYRNRQADEQQKGLDARSQKAWDDFRNRNKFGAPEEGLGGGGFSFGE